MAEAQTLAELREIRVHNRHHYESLPNVVGSMLGVKSQGGRHAQPKQAAIVYVVREKYDKAWLRDSDFIPPRLNAPNGLECATDVVESPTGLEIPLVRAESVLAGKLRGQHSKITIGSQLASATDYGEQFGSLAAFVETRDEKVLGFLTNEHVAYRPGNRLYHPLIDGVYLGSAPKVSKRESVNDWYGEYAGGSWKQPEYINSFVQTDCAFVRLASRWANDPTRHLDVEIFTDDDAASKEALGEFLPVDLHSLDLIGTKVRRLGRTTGLRKGSVEGYMYGELDEYGKTVYYDLVIRGEPNPNGSVTPFSAPGDSGSLVVTDASPHRPVAIMSGGNQMRMRNGTLHEDWTLAASIEPILDYFGLDMKTRLP